MRCGQPASLSWLGYFLSTDRRSAPYKRPSAVVVRRRVAKGAPMQLDDLYAVGLYVEFAIFGVGLGIYSTDDENVLRTIVAAPGWYERAIGAMNDALLRRGGHIVMTSYEPQRTKLSLGACDFKGTSAEWAERPRALQRVLPLQTSFEQTLMTLGRKTRLNLRYYRRQVATRLHGEFVADAAQVLTETAMLELNAHARESKSAKELLLLLRSSASLPGGFVAGLRMPGGPWLSAAGGWQQDGTAVLFWQSNRAGYESFSLSTAMRSYLLEHLVESGCERLMLYDGTTHSMSHSFQQQTMCDLVVRRRTLRVAVVTWLARFLEGPTGLMGRTHMLASLLRDPALVWHSGVSGSRRRDTLKSA